MKQAIRMAPGEVAYSMYKIIEMLALTLNTLYICISASKSPLSLQGPRNLFSKMRTKHRQSACKFSIHLLELAIDKSIDLHQ